MRNTATPILILAVAALLCPLGAAAESIFNLNFLGGRVESGDVRSIALGSGIQLIDDSLSVLQPNPATLARVRKVTFGASQYFSSDESRSNIVSEQNVSTKFAQFSFAFPITDRLTVALGYRGRYDPDGSFVIPGTTELGDSFDEIFTRSGGLFSFPVSAAVQVTRYISVGGFFAVENGTFESRWAKVFEDRAKAPAFTVFRREVTANAYGGGLLVGPLANVTASVSYEAEIDYGADVTKTFTNSSVNEAFSEPFKMPERWTVSAMWDVTETVSIHGAASFTDFTQFEGLSFPADRLYREDLATVGIELDRGIILPRRARLPLRLSATFERLPYDFPAGQRINTLLFGVGTGLNFRGGKGKIDFALQAGTVGSLDDNGLSNRVLRLYVGVGGSEIWSRERQTEF